jgi:phage protein U
MGQPHAYLGDIPLELPTYMSRFDVTIQADFAEHAKVGQKPRLQWVGDKLDEIQLDANLHAQFCTPEVELAKLRAAERKHEAMQLYFANGHIVGLFVLTAVEQRSQQTMRDGTLIVVDVSLSLREYTEDGLSTEVAASGTPVAAMRVGASGAEVGPNGTATEAAPERDAELPAVRAGFSIGI